MTTQYPGTLSYFNGYLTIKNPGLRVNAVLKNQPKLNLDFSGEIQIGKGKLPHHDIQRFNNGQIHFKSLF